MQIRPLAPRDWPTSFADLSGSGGDTPARWDVVVQGETSAELDQATYAEDSRILTLSLQDGRQTSVDVKEVWVRRSGAFPELYVVVPEDDLEPLVRLRRGSVDDAARSSSATFTSMTPDDAEALLRRNHVGRIAFLHDGEPRVVPLHYVYRNRCLYGRSTPSSELIRSVSDGDPVAFEVDEVTDLFTWRSVVVRGPILLMPASALTQQNERGRAVHLLRTLIPESLSERDPVPGRTCLFRIPVEVLSGRAASVSS